VPSLAFAKSTFGAVVQVSLRPSSRALGAPPPLPVPARPLTLKMLLDTGAQDTSVCSSKIDPSWGLYPATWYASGTLNGTSLVEVYELALSIHPSSGSVPFLELDPLNVASRPGDRFNGLPFHGVIGQDVLNRCRFVYDGLRHQCLLEY